MGSFKFLGTYDFPNDLKKMNNSELCELSSEIRRVMIDTVSKNGGHLSSNLGVVELSIALHKVFDSPKDKIIWDVGHQIYTHKILTGRFENFHTLRKEGGISGFSAPNESEHDIFYSGHSSTSISAALGVATANKLNENKDYTIAVIGDGALTGGLAYEALNNAGRSNTRLIIVLNDNEMSISPNVGSMARYLAVIRSKPEYFKLKSKTESAINSIPLIGRTVTNSIYKLKTSIKNRMYESTFFEELGFRYMGPIDGNSVEQVTEALETAKMMNRPIVLHINTKKGYGYKFAEESPSKYHGISKFDINNGETGASSPNFSSCFGNELCKLSENNNKICAITAAMALGTGLQEFSEKFPERFYDVGIAEEHAITFASGLARGGMIPIVAVYSTFLQRAYDQLLHDVSLQKQKVIIAIDRAGFVGDDGVTHQGLFDIPFLNSIPDITIYSPYTFDKLKRDLNTAINGNTNLTVVRYPRGTEVKIPDGFAITDSDYDFYEDGNKHLIITYGRLANEAFNAVKLLNERGIKASVLILNKIKPISEQAIKIASKFCNIYFYEESMRSGSIGQSFSEQLLSIGFKNVYEHIAVNDEFVAHADTEALMKRYHFDSESMINKITENNNG